jgi:hypothetical protein
VPSVKRNKGNKEYKVINPSCQPFYLLVRFFSKENNNNNNNNNWKMKKMRRFLSISIILKLEKRR